MYAIIFTINLKIYKSAFVTLWNGDKMRRVAEIIHIVENERDAFIRGAINPDLETQKVLWICGVRKQQYFALNELIFMTFEYEGSNFKEDMEKMASYLDNKNLLVKSRRKNVPSDKLDSTNWWAPVKRLGTTLDHNPGVDDESLNNRSDMLDGSMKDFSSYSDISFSEDDWSESFHF